jgi:hypothetical protein
MQSLKIRSRKVPYGGTTFNSLLEARWAVFMDCLEVAYQYEPHWAEVESALRRVRYKPDFLLPRLDKYLEIKPRKPSGVDVTKACGWASGFGDVVVLFNLNPPDEDNENGWLYRCKTADFDEKPTRWGSICWCECPRCSRVDLCITGEPDCGCFSLDELNRLFNQSEAGEIPMPFYRSNRIMAAYRKAKSHMFTDSKKVRPVAAQMGFWI